MLYDATEAQPVFKKTKTSMLCLFLQYVLLIYFFPLSSLCSLTLGCPSLSEAGSDSVHTDADDQRSSVSEPHRESSKSSNNNNNVVNATGHNMLSFEELPPIYFIKNLVVKPVRYSVTRNNLHFKASTYVAT